MLTGEFDMGDGDGENKGNPLIPKLTKLLMVIVLRETFLTHLYKSPNMWKALNMMICSKIPWICYRSLRWVKSH
jgi:hypothetical protein